MITLQQKQKILSRIQPYMALDKYGRTTIRNIYFDTDDYRLIRRSIEKPAYKEKLRIRSYHLATPDSTVFVELKKKYNHIVYKRRISLIEEQAVEWLSGKRPCDNNNQISKEIDYFLKYYKSVSPKAFLSYEREAYYSKSGDNFRITFDDNILFRKDDLSLEADIGGTPILDGGMVLMEIKCNGGIPLWMTAILSEEKIYKTAFSKYGTGYRKIILKET